MAVFFGIAVAGTWLARRYALARALLDHPGERRSHGEATPRGGGIAIVVAILLAAAVAMERLPGDNGVSAGFIAGFLLVATVGWIDDHRPLSAALRFGVHVLASAGFGLAVHLGGGPPWVVGLAFVAPLVLANVWNFMDGINGIAASQAAIVGLVASCFLSGRGELVALAIGAACLGFLPFNFPRARIFMGDVGSGALGFAIGALLAVSAMQGGWRPLWLLAPLAPFLVDAGLTLLRRMMRGEKWWTPHTQHAYQACARRFGHTAVTVAYGIVTIGGSILALAWARNSFSFMSFCLFTWYTSAAIAWGILQRSPGAGGRHRAIPRE